MLKKVYLKCVVPANILRRAPTLQVAFLAWFLLMSFCNTPLLQSKSLLSLKLFLLLVS